MEKTEWPSAAKMQAYRDSGIVPYSRLATAAAASAALFGSVFFMRAPWLNFLKVWRHAVEVGQITVLSGQIQDSLLRLLGLPVALSFLAALAVGLGQTRFFFRIENITPRLDRLNPFRPLSAKAFVKSILASLTAFTIIILLPLLLASLLIDQVLLLLNNNPSYFVEWPWQIYLALLPFITGTLAVIVFAAWLGARMAFMMSHRMSRDEMLQEQR